MPNEMQALELSQELGDGEIIRWIGNPHPRSSALSTVGQMIFGILWSLVAVSGLVSGLADGNRVAAAFVFVFVLIGAFMVCAPIITYFGARRTIYAVTDRRLIISAKDGRSTTSILLSRIGQVERVRKGDRITLRIPTNTVTDGDGLRTIDYTELHGLTDGERAFELLTRGNS